MKNNKIVVGVMAVMLVIGVGTVSVNKFNFTDSVIASTAQQYGSLKYDVNSNGTLKITDFDESVTDVEIPSEINGKAVTTIENYAFNNCKSLKSVTIPESIISIGYQSFAGCSAITSITIPNSVTSIGGGIFYGCTGLQSVTLSNNISDISNSAFYNCTGLKSITIPNIVTTIGSSAFSDCSGLKSITIPDNVTTIKSNAFSSCSALTSITVPENVTSIESQAFSYCTQLSEITILNPNCNINNSSYTISNDNGSYTGIIYGYENSTTQTYADKYNRNFQTIGSSSNNNSSEGDVNHDGLIDAVDASVILSYYAYLSTIPENEPVMSIFEFQNLN
ncbi:MAG: leucine-rich repeat protein [Ruminococcus flavefaciens]|nr:leucine-rich repeat protein [Ruminococcus flavefaciens]